MENWKAILRVNHMQEKREKLFSHIGITHPICIRGLGKQFDSIISNSLFRRAGNPIWSLARLQKENQFVQY